VGGAVLLACAAGQIWLLLGPHPYDPAYYFQNAPDFPEAARDYWTLRIGLMAPLHLAVLLFEPSLGALYAVPLLVALLLAGAVYGTMLALFRDRVLGAAAALVASLNPSWLLNSSFIFPDTAATATFTAGILCLILGRPRSEEPRTSWAPTAFAVSAGVLFGWTYLIREFSPILLPAVAAAFFLLRYPARRIAVVAGAALTTFSLELLYGLVGFGDPFVRVRVLLDRADKMPDPRRVQIMERIQEQIENPLESILVFPRLLLAWDTGWIFLVLLALFVAGLVRFRDRRLWLLAAWLFSFWAVMVAFGLWRLRSGELIVNVTNIRYWYPIFPPLVMGAFGSLGLLLQDLNLGRRAAALGLAAPVAAVALVVGPGVAEFESCAGKNVWRNEPMARWDELRSWFTSPQARRFDVVWADNYSWRLLPAFSRGTFGGERWPGTINRPGHGRPLQPPTTNLERSLLLVNKRFTNPDRPVLRRDWSPVFESRDGRIVLLAHARGTAGVGAEPWWSRPPRPRFEVGECGLSRYDAARRLAN
jgi:hypothetical protein